MVLGQTWMSITSQRQSSRLVRSKMYTMTKLKLLQWRFNHSNVDLDRKQVVVDTANWGHV